MISISLIRYFISYVVCLFQVSIFQVSKNQIKNKTIINLSVLCLLLQSSNMCKTYLVTAEYPIKKPNVWNKWIWFTALIFWIISKISTNSTNLNSVCHTKAVLVFEETDTKFGLTNMHTYIFLHESVCSKMV